MLNKYINFIIYKDGLLKCKSTLSKKLRNNNIEHFSLSLLESFTIIDEVNLL